MIKFREEIANLTNNSLQALALLPYSNKDISKILRKRAKIANMPEEKIEKYVRTGLEIVTNYRRRIDLIS